MPNTPPSIIAIDGPAASGKSTLGRRLADSLGYLFFDTGVMYRAVTWLALEKGVPPLDEGRVQQLLHYCDFVCGVRDGESTITIDGVERPWKYQLDVTVALVGGAGCGWGQLMPRGRQ